MKKFKDFQEKIEVTQDKDIDDRKGSQPASFQKGIKSKATKAARDAHFKKMTKADDNDPSAYKDAPGDKKARKAGTKESPYTKKFRRMYGESYSSSLYYLQPNGEWKKGGDGRSKGLKKEELPKNAKIAESTELSEDANATLKKKADKSGYSLSILKQVYKRGVAAWKVGHKPGTTPQQWGMARVNSFMTGGRTRVKGDPDLWAKQKGSIKKPKKVNEDAPCWDTHKQVGTKMKKGKQVPNCVPKNEDAKPFKPHMMYDPKTGKGYKAETEADHNRMNKLGYVHEKPDVNEALSMQQRRKAAIAFRRNKSKIRIGQERAKRRMASKEVLMKRARKAARLAIMKKLTKAASKGDMDFARREAIEKRLDKMKSKIDQVARKMYPEIRKKEINKRKGGDDK